MVFVALTRATSNSARSAFVAALFALHPLHVESVAWVAERKDVLSTLFGLLALCAYVGYARSGSLARYALCLLCFVCSLLSKQTLVTLPFVFLLLDYWPLGRLPFHFARQLSRAGEPDAGAGGSERGGSAPGTSWVRILLEKAPFLAMSAAFSAVALLAQAPARSVKVTATLPLSIRAANAVLAYAAYLAKTFVPINLAIYYPHPGYAIAWPAVWLAAGVLAAITAVAVITLRRFPFLFVGWAWFLGTLVPMIGIVQVGGQQMADRYTYFPLIGLYVAVVWLLCDLLRGGALSGAMMSLAAIVSLVALAATTFVQIGHWRDDVALFQHALASAPDNSFARNKLGCALLQQGQVPEAIGQFETAVRLDPQAIDPQYNLGLVYHNLGQLDRAADYYRAVLKITPRHAEAQNNLGAILLGRGQYAAAKTHFAKAVEISPDFVEANTNLGLVCLKVGDYAGAIAYSRRALDRNPRLADCRRTLAEAYLAQGRLDEAIGQLRELLNLAPNDRGAQTELARALAGQHGG